MVKGTDWEYEDEIRCLDMRRRSGIHSYRRELLESIILGCKFDEKLALEIKALIYRINNKFGLNIKLYKVEIVKDAFKIFIPGHPVYGDPDWEKT